MWKCFDCGWLGDSPDTQHLMSDHASSFVDAWISDIAVCPRCSSEKIMILFEECCKKMKRIQLNKDNKGIVDYRTDLPNLSKSRPGYYHPSGTEFTEDLVGGFGKFISDFVKDGFVVEVGCGSGIISKYCKAYLGIDGNIEAGNCCIGEFFPIDVYVPFDFDPPVEADFLLSFNFMEHLEEYILPEILLSFDKLLKVGGHIFFVIDYSSAQTEHLILQGDDWWHNQLSAVGWIRENISGEFRRSYFNNMPIHWKEWGLAPYQHLFLYRKG